MGYKNIILRNFSIYKKKLKLRKNNCEEARASIPPISKTTEVHLLENANAKRCPQYYLSQQISRCDSVGVHRLLGCSPPFDGIPLTEMEVNQNHVSEVIRFPNKKPPRAEICSVEGNLRKDGNPSSIGPANRRS